MKFGKIICDNNKKDDIEMLNTEKTMEKIVALCKNRGFVYAIPL